MQQAKSPVAFGFITVPRITANNIFLCQQVQKPMFCSETVRIGFMRHVVYEVGKLAPGSIHPNQIYPRLPGPMVTNEAF